MAINLAAQAWLCIIILMDLMADLATFERYYKLADLLIEQSTQEQLAESALLLALNVAHYQMKYGEIVLDDTLAMVDAIESNEEQLKLLVRGLEHLAGVLGNVSVDWEKPGIDPPCPVGDAGVGTISSLNNNQAKNVQGRLGVARHPPLS